MKKITGLTEDQAVAIAAALPQYRAIREVKVSHGWEGNRIRFTVTVETYSAEEVNGVVVVK